MLSYDLFPPDDMATTPSTAAILKGLDDGALVRRLADRRQEALGELYDRFASLLVALAQRILGSRAEAEEVLQETMLQAWSQAERYDSSRSSVSTWLVLIARSRALDRLRQKKTRERVAAAVEAEPPAPDTSSRGEEYVITGERRRRVRQVLDALPAEQREVLELAFFEGLSQTEIAARTRTPLGTVKTRSLLAMKKVRQALRDEIRDLM